MQTENPSFFSRRLLDLITIIICFSLPIVFLIPWYELPNLSDFLQYYAVSHMMQAGSYGQIYDILKFTNLEKVLVPYAPNGYCMFFLSPIFSWIFYPLALVKYKIALYLWTATLAALTLVSYITLCINCSINGFKRLWAIAFLVAFGPCLESIRLGQLSPILLIGLTGLLIGIKRKQAWLIGIAQSLFWVKPHLIFPILFFEYGAGLTSAVVFTSLIAIGGLLISVKLGGFDLLPAYILLVSSKQAQESFQPTLRGQLLKFSFGTYQANVLALLAALFVVVIAFCMGRLVKKKGFRLSILLTAIVPLDLCFALHLNTYDLILLVPGVLLLSSYPLTGFANKLRIFIISSLGLAFILPVYVFGHYYYVLRGGIINPFFWATLVFAIGAFIIEWQRCAIDHKLADNSNNY